MKKIISILLAAVMLFSMSSVAFASDKCDCGITPVIYVVGFGDPLYLNPESENPTAVFPPESDVIVKSLPSLLKAVSGAAVNDSEAFADNAMEALDIILGQMSFDENGESKYNVSISSEYAAFPALDTHKITHYRLGRLTQTDVPYGEFTFHQDWRVSPLDNAKRLKEYTDYVKEFTGHDKVSFVAHSQGNTIVAAYLALYGHDDIDTLMFLSPAYQGISLIGALLEKQASVGDKSGELTDFVESLLGDDITGKLVTGIMNVLKKAGVMDSLLIAVQKLLDEQFDRIFAESLTKLFGTMPGVWAFVPDEFYESAKAATLSDTEKYAKLIEKIDSYHYNVQNRLTDILNSALDDGVKLVIACGYNISTIPVNELEPGQSDMLIDTKYMSIGAVCAPFGKTLGDGYKQAVDCGHDHLSADGIIDASTAAFPEYTWFVKGLSHSDFTLGYLEFTDWALLYDGQPTVHTNEKFPQFMENNGNEEIIPAQPDNDSPSIFDFFKTFINAVKNLILVIFKHIFSF